MINIFQRTLLILLLMYTFENSSVELRYQKLISKNWLMECEKIKQAFKGIQSYDTQYSGIFTFNVFNGATVNINEIEFKLPFSDADRMLSNYYQNELFLAFKKDDKNKAFIVLDKEVVIENNWDIEGSEALSKEIFGESIKTSMLTIDSFNRKPSEISCLQETKARDAYIITQLDLKQISLPKITKNVSVKKVKLSEFEGYLACGETNGSSEYSGMLADDSRFINISIYTNKPCFTSESK